MKQAIGSVPLYNIIIVFIVITFGFLSSTLSYMKAFKVNGRIAKALENYEGYNELSKAEIDSELNNIGYRLGDADVNQCPTKEKNGRQASTSQMYVGDNYIFCLYEWPYYSNNTTTTKYFNYGIVTYIFVDIPVLGGTIKIPVYSETEKIFEFSS